MFFFFFASGLQPSFCFLAMFSLGLTIREFYFYPTPHTHFVTILRFSRSFYFKPPLHFKYFLKYSPHHLVTPSKYLFASFSKTVLERYLSLEHLQLDLGFDPKVYWHEKQTYWHDISNCVLWGKSVNSFLLVDIWCTL